MPQHQGSKSLYQARRNEHAVLDLIESEILQYDQASPLVRGLAELSHALVRIFMDEAYIELLPGFLHDRTSIVRLKLVRFIAFALEQHAIDRGKYYKTEEADILTLGRQFEIWAQELAVGRMSAKNVRLKIQISLSEEFSANLGNPRKHFNISD